MLRGNVRENWSSVVIPFTATLLKLKKKKEKKERKKYVLAVYRTRQSLFHSPTRTCSDISRLIFLFSYILSQRWRLMMLLERHWRLILISLLPKSCLVASVLFNIFRSKLKGRQNIQYWYYARSRDKKKKKKISMTRDISSMELQKSRSKISRPW